MRIGIVIFIVLLGACVTHQPRSTPSDSRGDAGPASSAAHDGPTTVRGTITNIGSAERPVIALRAAPSGTFREERLLYIVDPDRLLTGIAVDAVVDVSGVYLESPRWPATDATLRIDSVTVIDEPAVPTFPYRG